MCIISRVAGGVNHCRDRLRRSRRERLLITQKRTRRRVPSGSLIEYKKVSRLAGRRSSRSGDHEIALASEVASKSAPVPCADSRVAHDTEGAWLLMEGYLEY